MTEYSNELRGVLFKNERKEKDTHPDYKGSAEVGGVEYWLSSWIKVGKGGAKFMSLSFTAKEEPKDTRTLAERKRPKDEVYRAGSPNDRSQFPDDLSDVPF
jgi:uncharacterized protein (DUF736 family)